MKWLKTKTSCKVRSMPTEVYYNDNDIRACATLRETMADGLISEGIVDERDIADIRPEELAGYDRVHLFAGIGGFEFAARLAGWPTGVQLWTGGFPCQPFSVAGLRSGAADHRYLWPELYRLIRGGRPEFVLVENVPAIDSEPDLVLDRVLVDLEACGYETWTAEIPACAVDAAHKRTRVWIAGALDNRNGAGLQERGDLAGNARSEGATAERGGACAVGGWQRQCTPSAAGAGDVGWIACYDGKFRRLPLRFLDPSRVLADGLPSRYLALHGLGNSIVPQVASQVMRAMLGY